MTFITRASFLSAQQILRYDYDSKTKGYLADEWEQNFTTDKLLDVYDSLAMCQKLYLKQEEAMRIAQVTATFITSRAAHSALLNATLFA